MCVSNLYVSGTSPREVLTAGRQEDRDGAPKRTCVCTTTTPVAYVLEFSTVKASELNSPLWPSFLRLLFLSAMSSFFPSLFLLPSRPIQRQKIFMSESIARFFLSILLRRRISTPVELPRSSLPFFPLLLVVERRWSLPREEKKRQSRWQGDQRIPVLSFLVVPT